MPREPAVVMLVGPVTDRASRCASCVGDKAVVISATNLEAARAMLDELLDGGDPPCLVETGQFSLDLATHEARYLGEELPLSEREVQILACLLEEPASVHTFDELYSRAWGRSYFGDAGPVHAAVKRLRRKLIQAEADLWVESVRGVGFRLVCPRVAVTPKALQGAPSDVTNAPA